MSRGLGKLQICILKELQAISLGESTGPPTTRIIYLNIQEEYWGEAIVFPKPIIIPMPENPRRHKIRGRFKVTGGGHFVALEDPELNKRRASISQSLRLLIDKDLISHDKVDDMWSITNEGREILSHLILKNNGNDKVLHQDKG